MSSKYDLYGKMIITGDLIATVNAIAIGTGVGPEAMEDKWSKLRRPGALKYIDTVSKICNAVSSISIMSSVQK